MAHIVSALERRGFGPLLLGPSLLIVLPTGIVPGVPTVAAALIIFIAGQIVLGRPSPWLPPKLARYAVSKKRFDQASEKIKPWTCKIDLLLKPRLTFLVTPLAIRLIAALCFLMSLPMPLLEFIPFGSNAVGYSVLFISLGISARDGLLVAIGLGIVLGGFSSILMGLL